MFRKFAGDLGAITTTLGFISFEALNQWSGWIIMILVGVPTIVLKWMELMETRKRKRAEKGKNMN